MTLDVTTQHHLRSTFVPLNRQCTIDRMFEVPRLRCTMYAKATNPRFNGVYGFKHCQVFGNKQMFTAAHPV